MDYFLSKSQGVCVRGPLIEKAGSTSNQAEVACGTRTDWCDLSSVVETGRCNEP